MQVSSSDLHAIPLFQNITEAHLTELMAAFERLTLGADHVLFEAGSAPTHFLLLVSGEVALREGAETRFRLSPLAPIGELGAVTGLTRSTTAVTTQPSEVLSIRVETLQAFFEKHGDVAFPFYHNLVNVVADKVRRDTRRVDAMRTNLIRTQKAMKRLMVWRSIACSSPSTYNCRLRGSVFGSSLAASSSSRVMRYQPSSLIVSLMAGFDARSRCVSNCFCFCEGPVGAA